VHDRVGWAELPGGLRTRIEALTGPVISTQPVGTGHNSQVALAVHAPDRAVFLKGVRDSQPRAVRTQAAEAAINPVVAPVTADWRSTSARTAGTSSGSGTWPGTGTPACGPAPPTSPRSPGS
jgi:hypothetical protein